MGALAAAGSLPLTYGLPASRWVRRSPLHALQRLARAHFMVSSIVSSASMHMHVRCHACCCSCMAVEHVRARSRDVPAAPLAWTARGASSRASLALGSGHACALPGSLASGHGISMHFKWMGAGCPSAHADSSFDSTSIPS